MVALYSYQLHVSRSDRRVLNSDVTLMAWDMDRISERCSLMASMRRSIKTNLDKDQIASRLLCSKDNG